jgi:nucleotide sugar dehydrogenase
MIKEQSSFSDLRICSRGTNVCVIGLGRIGLPIALVTASRGRIVYGVDKDPAIVNGLRKGHVIFSEPRLGDLIRSCGNRFKPTTNLNLAVRKSSVVLCCVGTRRFADKRPDLTLLRKIFRGLADCDIARKLIILKTTVPVGTTRNLAKYLERRTGMRVDNTFYMAFSPERTVEGNAVHELETLPVLVGGVGEESLRRAIEFYETMGVNVVNVVKAEAAEFAKLIDNSYRITRFAFSNDLALVAERIGLNAYDIIDACNYGYKRNDIPYPTCGVSGYCLTKDPYYLEEVFRPISKERGFGSMWLAARKSYDFRIGHLIKQIGVHLTRMGARLSSSEALVCGVAFKSNSDDVRDSHGLAIARKLMKKGMKVAIWDPCISARPRGFDLCNDAITAFKGKDVAIFTVAHSQFSSVVQEIQRYTKLMRTPLIYDGAGLLRGKRPSDSFSLIGTGFPDSIRTSQKKSSE